MKRIWLGRKKVICSVMCLLLVSVCFFGAVTTAAAVENKSQDSYIENFESDELKNMGITSEMNSEIVTSNTISGEKSLKVTIDKSHTKAWKNIIKCSPSAPSFSAGKTYSVSLKYSETADIGVLQFAMVGIDGGYFRVSNGQVIEEGKSITASATKKDGITSVFFAITLKSNSELVVCKTNDWISDNEEFIYFDDITVNDSLKINEDFENISDISESYFIGANNTIEEGMMRYIKTANWQNMIGIGNGIKMLPDTDYTLTFDLKTTNRSGLLQFYTSGTDWIRINYVKQSVVDGSRKSGNLTVGFSIMQLASDTYRIRFTVTSTSKVKFGVDTCEDTFSYPFFVDNIIFSSGKEEPLSKKVIEDFEINKNIADNSPFGTKDSGTTYTDKAVAISGDRSFKFSMSPAQNYVDILTLSNLEANKTYTFRFSYKNLCDMPRMVFDLYCVDAVFFDTSELQVLKSWSNTMALSGYKDANNTVHAQIVFKTGNAATYFSLKTGSDFGDGYSYTGNVELILDDLLLFEGDSPELIEPGKETKYEYTETFEDVSSLDDTFYSSDIKDSLVSYSDGNIGLKLTADSSKTGHSWKRLIKHNYKRLRLAENTDYTVRFKFKVLKGNIDLLMFETSKSDYSITGDDRVCAQIRLSDFVMHWQTSVNETPNSKFSYKKYDDGMIEFQFVFHTAPENVMFNIYNGNFDENSEPFEILFDDIIVEKGISDDLKPYDEGKQKSVYIDFENILNLKADTPFETDASDSEICKSGVIYGKKGLLIKNNPADWLSIIKLNSSEYFLRPNTTYKLELYYTDLSGLDQLQFAFIPNEGEVTWCRWNKNLFFVDGSGNIEFRAKTMENGSKRLRIRFTTGVSGGYLCLCTCDDSVRDNIPIKFLVDNISLVNVTNGDGEIEVPLSPETGIDNMKMLISLLSMSFISLVCCAVISYKKLRNNGGNNYEKN